MTKSGDLLMSSTESKRLHIIEQIQQKKITQIEGAKTLGMSERQLRRLIRSYEQNGLQALISKKRGCASNRSYPNEHKQKILGIVQARYSDFGPTLATENLAERDGIQLGKETLRRWLIEAKLHKPKRKPEHSIHLPRERRSYIGALVQIDGSLHDWFEGRSGKCTLITFIDDATSTIQYMQFFQAETTVAYLSSLVVYLKRLGIPMSLYSDKHGIFKVNNENAQTEKLTQFGRVCEEIGIELIHAETPQAKGRVERAFKTLQDRLPKWLRLEGIDTYEEANKVLETFREKYNQKFAKVAKDETDIHQPIELPLDKFTFAIRDERVVNRNGLINYENKVYLVDSGSRHRLMNKRIYIYTALDGELAFVYDEKEFKAERLEIIQKANVVLDSKALQPHLDKRRSSWGKRHKPSATHPWRRPWMRQKQVELHGN
jgi:transposase